MKKRHRVGKIIFKKNLMVIDIDGKEHISRLADVSKKLANASSIEKEKYEISPSGYGIHWPLIDEDLSIDGLLGIVHNIGKKKEKVST
ncbi:MAG: DUF2442 domain-containing protein [Nitrospinota bacterium]